MNCWLGLCKYGPVAPLPTGNVRRWTTSADMVVGTARGSRAALSDAIGDVFRLTRKSPVVFHDLHAPEDVAVVKHDRPV